MISPRYRYAIIGTGRESGTEGATGFGMANPHFRSYRSTDRVDLVAISDISSDPAQFFLAKHELENVPVFPDYKEMLAEVKPDIVSICTWPHLHTEMVIAACEARVPAVHCEKPMALTWGDAKRMKAAAEAHGTILIFNHQRRFLDPFQKVRELIVNGAIGQLQRMEATCGDIFDWGTHWVDMLFFMNSETPVSWVIGQIDSTVEKRTFGAWTEEQAIAYIKYDNDVRGFVVTGYDANIGTAIRLTGTTGTIEIGWDSVVQIRAAGDADWRKIETTESIHSEKAIPRVCLDLIAALDDRTHRPLLTVDNAIRATEVIYAVYESSRRRGRVDFPLDKDDLP